MKQCSKCKEEKSFDNFHKNTCNKDGYNYQCKTCRKEGCAKYFSSLSQEEKQKRVEQKRKWAGANKERVREYSKIYSQKNLPLRAAAQKKREAAKKKRMPPWLTSSDLLRIRCYYQVAAMRSKETGFKWHVDHIVPLQGDNVSGLHVPWNLQVIPALENLRKHNKHE